MSNKMNINETTKSTIETLSAIIEDLKFSDENGADYDLENEIDELCHSLENNIANTYRKNDPCRVADWIQFYVPEEKLTRDGVQCCKNLWNRITTDETPNGFTPDEMIELLFQCDLGDEGEMLNKCINFFKQNDYYKDIVPIMKTEAGRGFLLDEARKQFAKKREYFTIPVDIKDKTLDYEYFKWIDGIGKE